MTGEILMLMVHSLPTSGKMSKKGKNISIYSRFLDHQISILALKILTVQAVHEISRFAKDTFYLFKTATKLILLCHNLVPESLKKICLGFCFVFCYACFCSITNLFLLHHVF